ncbi:S1 RNA-binding domain-containing protein [Pendulispora brunnea]|uniref:S1 RNA-binding domain-containing protein n=1 Tax=Pendulispora brunnea TaxID=2905690 RepID=A0ABZ2KLB4_9BACT
MSSEKRETPGTEDSFAAMFEREAPAMGNRKRGGAPRVGAKVDGVVVQVGRDSVFVELDGKRQAFFDAAELRAPDGTISVKEGDRVTAQVVESDDAKGIIRLGRSMGKPGSLAALEQARESGLGVEGKVTGVNKGGLDVDVGGMRAFCPMSQIDVRRVEDADAKALIGQLLRFVVTDIRDGGKNIVVSRRAFLQQESSEAAARALVDIVPGAVLTGTVSSVRDFGAFVDLGGIEGLIPRSEIAHDRSVSVDDALKPGDTVEVQVREVKDVEPAKASTARGATKKITLSLKALTADPWAELALVEGRVALGTVTRETEFGLFVRLGPGVEGLVHVSELGRGTKPAEGQEIRVVVKKIDRASRKISLVPAPDDAQVGGVVATGTVKVGAIVSGAVERIEQYGLFVQIDGTKGKAGRGLVPVAEIGVPRGTDLRKSFPEGTKVTAKVLETGDGRLRLSIKGALADQERGDYEAARGKAAAPASLGTFADLLKKSTKK